MGKMTKQEFEAIYKNITSTQHSVLEMFLEGRLDPEISEVLYKDRTAVSSNISRFAKCLGWKINRVHIRNAMI